MTKIRMVLDGGDYFDLAAEQLTFDADAVVLWANGVEVGRHARGRLAAVDLSVGSENKSRSAAAQARLEKIRARYPNAFLPWQPDHEAQLIARHGEGASIADLANELGRQPGGIEARLERLGLIEGERPSRRRSRR